MQEKYLPIKIFEKRKDYDDRETEGGGNDKPASWILSGDELNLHSKRLCNNIRNVQTKYNKWKAENKRLPMVITSTINEKALAKSYRSKIVNVLESDNKNNVIGFYGNKNIISIVSSDEVISNIENMLESVEEQATLISSFMDIDVFKPFIKKNQDESNAYKIKLLNFNNYDLNNITKILFEQQCQEKGIIIEARTKYTSDLTIFRVCIDNLEKLNEVEDFEGVYSVEPMETIDISLDFLDDGDEVVAKKPKVDGDYPIVGVLDTGIAQVNALNEWITDKQFMSYPKEYQNNSHGTFVAGVIEYGDELNGTKTSALDGVKIFDATVYPDTKKDTIYVNDLIDNIREAVKRNNHIKIWNMSLGTRDEAALDKFSDFGMALDDIQDENNVLIIKSAGNCANFTESKAKSRIAKSADSVRSLVVGSIAEIQGKYDYAEPNTPSPFTRIGPGPSHIIKPDLVFYGGNAGIHEGRIIKNGVPSFDIYGRVVRDCGTSFSTPRVTRIAAELNYLMKEDFDPLLIRALLIHSAQYPSNIKMNMSDKINQLGFGMPLGTQEILYNSPDEITIILRDTLEKSSFIEMFDFPYPKSLIDENGNYRGQIIMTLVNKCIIDDKQDGEYCQSNIDVLFGTYDTEKDRDTSKPTIKNPKGVGGAKNILNSGLYSSSVSKVYAGTGFERECILTRYGKKFHPVKKFAIDLKDMTTSNREKYLDGDRKWYLKIEGLYRDFIENDAKKNNYQLSQEYCMILTIKDPLHTVQVYDEVTQLLTYNNFIHHNIQVRNDIHVTAEQNS